VSERIKAVTHKDFASSVLEHEGLTLVDFWAPWCGPCKQLAPVLESVADRFEEDLRIVKIDVDEDPALARRYKVSGLPALLFFRGGEVIETLAGFVPENRLADRVTVHLTQAL
jgi:thioredoxin 1